MTLNDLLILRGFDPAGVLVLRHRPRPPALRRALPWLAVEHPDVFNAYQQTQGPRLERTLTRASHVASFIGLDQGYAHFVALYRIGHATPLTRREYAEHQAYQMLRRFGASGYDMDDADPRPHILHFDLVAEPSFYADWQGKLIVRWPPPERSWWRRGDRNVLPVAAILETSAFVQRMPPWEQLVLSWGDLHALPHTWRATMAQWRAIYYIVDTSDGRGYVGSAAGSENLLGRWLAYASDGHGGNALLRDRMPEHLQFSILQRVSPDMDIADVIRLEHTWKERLRTRAPHGLNDN